MSDQQETDFQSANDEKVLKQIKSAQTFLTVAMIAAPVSLIIGGVILSAIALIFAIIGTYKLNKVKNIDSQYKAMAKSIFKQFVIVLSVCAFALILNAISFAYAFNALYDALQSGNLDEAISSLYGTQTDPNANGSATDTSIWDS